MWDTIPIIRFSHWPDEPFSKRKCQILRLGSLMETVGRTSPSAIDGEGFCLAQGFNPQ